DKLLLVLSEQSITSSWVRDEVEAAYEKEERQKRDVLFPIRLDDMVMQASQAWAAKLRRSRHIGGFRKWTDPQSYQTNFTRLLRDLKQA
ncbi:MAG TPA: TIR domain-containing protein, partial [Ktedonobacteraceae bacterium]|nr:TIR domain-containing protein [Ktedonobacteraceae bacterium]